MGTKNNETEEKTKKKKTITSDDASYFFMTIIFFILYSIFWTIVLGIGICILFCLVFICIDIFG